MQLVCKPCKVAMRCKKTGDAVEYDGYLWAADTFYCPSCDTEDVSVLAGSPIRRLDEIDYQGVQV